MTSVPTMIGLLAEVFSIVGFACGAICFIILLAMRLSRGGWRTAPAAISEGRLSWLAIDGDVYQRELTEAELALTHDEDSLEVFHRTRSIDCYFRRSAPDEKLVLTLGIIFGGIGVLASVASIVVLFFE
ncbi:MAG: hypothetical protein H7226_01835 [Salinibacterium sp.]|nr:hypothetical protein [Salinibacterium sp.]